MLASQSEVCTNYQACMCVPGNTAVDGPDSRSTTSTGHRLLVWTSVVTAKGVLKAKGVAANGVAGKGVAAEGEGVAGEGVAGKGVTAKGISPVGLDNVGQAAGVIYGM